MAVWCGGWRNKRQQESKLFHFCNFLLRHRRRQRVLCFNLNRWCCIVCIFYDFLDTWAKEYHRLRITQLKIIARVRQDMDPLCNIRGPG